MHLSYTIHKRNYRILKYFDLGSDTIQSKLYWQLPEKGFPVKI